MSRADLQKRWIEARPSQVAMLYTHAAVFDDQFLSQLDGRVVVFADEMTSTELVKTFCGLGTSKRRKLPVLNVLATLIANQEQTLSPKQLSNILFAMNTLTFHHSYLFNKLASDLVSQVERINKPKLINSILICIGQIKWKNCDLLEALSNWIEKNVGICPNESLAIISHTLANVSYLPSNADSLFSVITPRLSP